MDVLIVAINSQYIHSSLAPWYLKENIKDENVKVSILEKNINQDIDEILYEILGMKTDAIYISVYIWNIDYIKRIVRELKKIRKDVKIVLGGPEVSYDDLDKVILQNSDYIIKGEGEFALRNYIEKNVVTDELNIIKDLDKLKSPYTNKMLNCMNNKIIYYESSRGCPFKCSYCLSSTIRKVRYFSLKRVFLDLDKIIASDVKLVKFVDRTFNANLKRAKEIVRYLIENGNNKTYHFEIVADNLDDEIISLFNGAPKGLFQLEIGIQSLNQKTLEEIDRKFDIKKAKYNIKRLIEPRNINIHLDLIAFLPYEDLDSFIRSFNWIYQLKVQEIQIGFLKMLKGTKIFHDKNKHGYVVRDYSPYEVLANYYMSFKDGVYLHKIEKIFNRLYNRSHFTKTLCKIEEKYENDYFKMFADMVMFFEQNGFFERKFSFKNLCGLIYEYGKSIDISLKDEIVFDFLSIAPSFALDKRFFCDIDIKNKVLKFVKKGILDDYYKDLKPQKIMKKISYYPFSFGDYVFLSEFKDEVTNRSVCVQMLD